MNSIDRSVAPGQGNSRVAPEKPSDHLAVDVRCIQCGYSLFGLSAASRCPECGRAIIDSTHDRPLPRTSRATREWAWIVLAGLSLLLWVVPSQIEAVISMSFGDGLGGTAPRLNLPAPKIWAVPMIQRSLGWRPQSLGVGSTMGSLLCVASVFLITTRRTHSDWYERVCSLRRIARWVPVVLAGGWLGFLMNMEYLDGRDIGFQKFIFVAVLFVELPATAVLYLYLWQLAQRLEMSALARALGWATIGVVALLLTSALMLIIDRYIPSLDRKHIQWQATAAIYMAASVTVSLVMTGAVLRLAIAMLRLAWPGRAK